ncbi:polysaccharide deacetylase family protein [Lentiprolixibacter aurantiacus]|uniref:Polysaccharide deacetylase family protein n=1 Tax=Lentiprolixibacter aurantiacus TaxID=2993939 RepID=A0AAE3SPJ5_9FLAO|nr:polysaccharide deacetylase family protein [Lentiprolixibacter aurantiacus]MCX2719597.1 polysaccharide deacetylase family protein [Lentiprolixibacter aurantiacus]
MGYRIMMLVAVFSATLLSLQAQDKLLARLGYPEGTRLLIVHADDLGVSHSENMASIKALEGGIVNSASIMVPCPWFPEIASYAGQNSEVDLGLHLTLNSEWNSYKWGPVSSKDLVPSLLNDKGYFYSSVDSLMAAGQPDEVELELTNQVKKALEAGIDVTHLDAHMGAAVSKPEFLVAYMRVGRAFELPVLLDKRVYESGIPEVQNLIDENTVIVDNIFTMGPQDFEAGVASYYNRILRELPSGLNCLLIHLAYDNEEMKAMTTGHRYWASDWRQADFDYFTSEAYRKLLEEENIKLITWRELRDRITSNK